MELCCLRLGLTLDSSRVHTHEGQFSEIENYDFRACATLHARAIIAKCKNTCGACSNIVFHAPHVHICYIVLGHFHPETDCSRLCESFTVSYTLGNVKRKNNNNNNNLYREVTGSNPVKVLNFSGFYTQLLKLRS